MSIFRFFRQKKHVNNLPNEFSDSEKIVRAIFSPINFNKAGTRLLPNTFRSPAGIDEVSVTRLSYSGANFCKQHGKIIENPENKRSFFGLALLYVTQIISTESKVEYSPKRDNIYHADIKIGFVPEKNQQLPAEFQKKIKELTVQSKLFIDGNHSSNNWDGSPIE